MRFFSAAFSLSMFTALASSYPALAWDPNEGAETPTMPSVRPYTQGDRAPRTLSTPTRSTRPAQPIYAAPAPAQYQAPVRYAPPAPTPPAPSPAPAVATAPSATYAPPPAPVYATSPAYAPSPVYAPAYAAPMGGQTYPSGEPMPPVMPIAAPAHVFKKNQYSFGIEAFYDHYEEPETFPDLSVHSYYGALNVAAEHYYTREWYQNLEGRVSYGTDNYKSNSGSLHGVPQWELEGRVMGGYRHPVQNGAFKYYTGLGTRYYVDEGKGEVTNLGAFAYDRRIFQLYIPIGMTYEFAAYGLQFAPNVEVDSLLYGHVNSRLGSIPGYENFGNRQKAGSGIGWRAEMMVGQRNSQGRGWQAGPFVRYWRVDDSELDVNSSGGGLEPENTRLQLGAKMEWLF